MNINKSRDLTLVSYVFIGKYDTHSPIEPYEKTGTIEEFGAFFKDKKGNSILLTSIDVLYDYPEFYDGLLKFKNSFVRK